jgi:hypothetical protein
LIPQEDNAFGRTPAGEKKNGFSFMGDNTKEAVDPELLSLRKQLEMMEKLQELLQKEAEL